MIDAPIAQIVKIETSAFHQEVEEVLLLKLQSIQSKRDYVQLLQFFYGYFFPVEEAIQKVLTTTELADIHQRRTASLILDDLHSLGESSLPPCSAALPVIQHKSQAFGALYVLEGSTLGGRVIAKMLAKNAAFPIPENALHFFHGYGSQTGHMWTQFLKALNQQSDVDAIVYTASQTFLLLKNWMHSFYESNES